MDGQITYSMLSNMTMTLTECNKIVHADKNVFIGILFMFLLVFIVYAVLYFMTIIERNRMRGFIKYHKLEKHFQEYNNMNKGL